TAALVCLDVPVPAIMGLCINKSNVNSDGKNVDDDDRSSDTSDELTFEVQRCVVHIDTGHNKLPNDMSRFPDRTCFINELNNILLRFNNYILNWTHIYDENLLKESNYEPSQALARLAAIAKRAGIVINNNDDGNSNSGLSCLFNESELHRISANNCLRASFINRFAQLFSQMDAFICYPPVGKYSNVDQLYFSDHIRLYCDCRDLTYQYCSLIVMNAPLVRPLDNSFSISNNSYLFENLNESLLESTTSIDISSSFI
ncbi:unnamed protein product, partial [Rotaria sp. Silwood1]